MARAGALLSCGSSEHVRDCQVMLTQQFGKSIWSAPWRSSNGTKKLFNSHNQSQWHETKMSRSARPQLAPPPPRRRLHRLQATPVVRCAESSCTSPSAPPCRGWRPRAAITTLRGGHNNKCADWCTSPQPKSSGSTQSFAFKSSGSTQFKIAQEKVWRVCRT